MTKFLNNSLRIIPNFCLYLEEKEWARVHKGLTGGKAQLEDFVKHEYGAATHIYDSDGDVVCVVCMKAQEKREFSETIGILAHGAMHVAQETFKRIGEESPGVEFEAYTVQQITTELVREYLKKEKTHATQQG